MISLFALAVFPFFSGACETPSSNGAILQVTQVIMEMILWPVH